MQPFFVAGLKLSHKSPPLEALPHYVKSPIFVQKEDFDKTYFEYVISVKFNPP